MLKRFVALLSIFAALILSGADKTGGPDFFEVLKDNKGEYSFLMESRHGCVINIKPEKFKVQKGKTYFVDNTSDVPHQEIKAEKDGELKLVLPLIERAGFAISEVKEGNMLGNGSFEFADGWIFKSEKENSSVKNYGFEVEKRFSPLPPLEGKPDKFEYSTKFKRSGKFSVMLEKNSANTFVSLSSRPVPVEAGKTYYYTAFYYPEKFDYNTAFSLNARLFADGKAVTSVSDRYWISFPPFFTEPGQWRYTFNAISTGKDPNAGIKAVSKQLEVPAEYLGKKLDVVLSLEIDGSPGRIYWDDIDFRPCPVLATQPGKEVETSPVISQEKLDEKLAAMKDSEAKVIQYHQRPVLEIDGKPEPCFIISSQNSGLAYTAGQQGVKIIVVHAKINEWLNIKKSVWKGRDEYDFSILENEIRKILCWCPDAKIILHAESIYNKFTDDYPESGWVTGDGRIDINVHNSIPVKKTSHISENLRKELGKTYRMMGEFLRKSPVGKAVIGMHLAFGDDGQWYPNQPWTLKTFDYSEGSRLGIIEELKKMYGNDIKALRAAWQNPEIRFEDIKMPLPDELSPEKYFLSPDNGNDRRLIDCVIAYHKAVLGTINTVAAEFKKGIAKAVVVFTYFPDNCILTQGEMLKSSDIDGIVALPSYLRNRNMGSHNQSHHAHGSFRLHGKIYMDEVDFRSEYGAVKDRFYRRWLGMSGGLKEHFNQMRRNYAFLYSQGEWGWGRTIGMQGHFVWYGCFASILGEIQRAAEMSLNPPVENDWGQVAVFRDDLAQAYFSFFQRRDHFLNYAASSIRGLSYSGLTWNAYLLSDLENPQRPHAKINLFSTATTMNGEQIDWIEKNLQKDGNILIFAGDAGRTAQGGFEKNIKRLTGMNIKSFPDMTVPYDYSQECFTDILSSGPANSLWGKNTTGPLYLVDDPEAITVAALSETKLPGMAVKRHKDWTAVYIAGSCEEALSSEFFRRLAEEAKVKPIGPAGDITYAGNGFLAIHAASSGEKTLNLKGAADLFDITENKTVAENVKAYTVKMKFGETCWFRVKYR